MESLTRYIGVVRWFDVRLGYGFIESQVKDMLGRDVFIHWSQIICHGNRYDKRKANLVRGDVVQFSLKESQTKNNQLQALNVIKTKQVLTPRYHNVYQLTRFDILKYNSAAMNYLYL